MRHPYSTNISNNREWLQQRNGVCTISKSESKCVSISLSFKLSHAATRYICQSLILRQMRTYVWNQITRQFQYFSKKKKEKDMSTTRRERTRDIGDRQDQERVNATTFERVNATTFGNGDNTRHSKQNRKFWNCEIEAEMKGKSSQESEQRRTNPGESRFALFSFYRPLIWVKKERKNVKSNQPTEWEASNLRNEKSTAQYKR